MLLDHNGANCPARGIGDLRDKLHACLQYRREWCWATSVALVANYYKPDLIKIVDDNCRGLECEIVGSLNHRDCCSNKDACADINGTAGDITIALHRFSDQRFRVWWSSLSQERLQQILIDGNPVVIAIDWNTGGGHVMLIGGTNGQGVFYLHDPMNIEGEGSFQSLAYADIIAYRPPYNKQQTGTWHETYALAEYGSCTMPQSDEEWQRYCEAANPKAWAFRDDCAIYYFWWGSSRPAEDALNGCGSNCHLYDLNGKQC
ncbi:unnamed protein product [Prorocentrum cordatum]|uniref:Peptidase C39-like domain-containing protein n=1 Tax=Prorocentrum cordatum TaxID=2364126 RepID=A0ABN9VIM1_9DINO|nr:unnamed protein product [Polarella glacialis]